MKKRRLSQSKLSLLAQDTAVALTGGQITAEKEKRGFLSGRGGAPTSIVVVTPGPPANAQFPFPGTETLCCSFHLKTGISLSGICL